MSAHTPGPWLQHPTYPLIIKQDCAPIAGPDEDVMICNAQSHNNSGFFPSFDEGRANARLIAAAPELLEALEAAEQAMTDVCDCGECGGCQVTAQTRAAIAKAKGE